MSDDSQDPSNQITADSSPNDSKMDPETPDIGIGLILLGGICLLFGIAIGLIFTVKWS